MDYRASHIKRQGPSLHSDRQVHNDLNSDKHCSPPDLSRWNTPEGPQDPSPQDHSCAISETYHHEKAVRKCLVCKMANEEVEMMQF